MEEVNAYRYLGVNVMNDGKMNGEVNHRIGEAEKVSVRLQNQWKRRCITREAKVRMYEWIVEPSLLHGSEVCGLNVHERKRTEALEMKCLRNICGMRKMGRFRNEEIR